MDDEDELRFCQWILNGFIVCTVITVLVIIVWSIVRAIG